ncbi:MAG: anaerobic ribonucleoside-triphosphate reductase activating protein, partial [Candidatus Adiutrix sp.]|jgi:pyruvate formate lyase activating enzyme|nr:anaerobic ribonucleoside-triphosphate reductase activating protein [Candidatus Adiutrix sp.]
VLFTQGCNFTCPYCHNPQLVRLFGEPLAEEDALAFLRRRRRYLGGVVISGGEPTLQPDLPEFCKKIQGLGYAVKLDTNGSAPKLLSDLIERRLINYLALDIKADPRAYPPEIAPKDPGEAIMETITLLKRGALPHEYRVTAAAPFISRHSLESIARAAAGNAPLFLQPCRTTTNLDPDFMSRHPPPGLEELRQWAVPAAAYLPIHLRA